MSFDLEALDDGHSLYNPNPTAPTGNDGVQLSSFTGTHLQTIGDGQQHQHSALYALQKPQLQSTYGVGMLDVSNALPTSPGKGGSNNPSGVAAGRPPNSRKSKAVIAVSFIFISFNLCLLIFPGLYFA